MGNPFEILEARLSSIEKLLIDLLEKRGKQETQQDEILNVQQASKLLDLAVPTIYSMVSERRIPFSKAEGGKKLMFIKSELIEWVKTTRKPTTLELNQQYNEKQRKK